MSTKSTSLRLLILFLLIGAILTVVFVVVISVSRCVPPPSKNTNVNRSLNKAALTSNIVVENIDLVVTWFDPMDEERNALRKIYLEKEENVVSTDGKSSRRFTNFEELKYVLRSIDTYAPWIRYVWILCSDNQRPKWLPENQDRIRIVSDRDIMDPEHLPTFNSHALECHLHKIPGLSEFFLYGCDDMFFGNVCNPDYFLDEENRMRLFFTPGPVPFFDTPSETSDHHNAWFTNAQILKTVGITPDRYPAHNITILSQSAMALAMQTFPEVWQATSASKFRHKTNIHPVGLSQFMSVSKNMASWSSPVLGVFQVHNSYTLNELLFGMLSVLRPVLFCINDETNYPSENVKKQFKKFLEFYFPIGQGKI